MKVIKKTDISNWSYKYQCSNCDSELEVEQKDIKYTYYAGDMREPSSEVFSATCVVCNHSFNVPGNSIPKLMKTEIKDKQKKSSPSGYYDR